jgi:hypothetical protein
MTSQIKKKYSYARVVKSNYLDWSKRDINAGNFQTHFMSLTKHKVEAIDMCNNVLGDGPDAVASIEKFFKSVKVEYLDMSGNKFGPNVAKTLAKVLVNYEGLRCFFLSKDEFSPEEISILKACSDAEIDFY